MSTKYHYLKLQESLENIASEFDIHPVTPMKVKSLLRDVIHEVNLTAKHGFCEHLTKVPMTDTCIRGDIEYNYCVECGLTTDFKIIT